MGRKRNKQSEQFYRSALANTWSYLQYEDMLTEIALARFDWQGLPDTIDHRYMERALLFQGKALYFKDEVMGDLALKVTLNSKFDVYGIPTLRQAYGENGYTTKRTPNNSVIIWNNLNHKPTFPIIQNYAMRMYDLDQTIDVNARAQKTPVLVTCDEAERLSLENLYTQYDGNRPVIYGSRGLSPDALQVLKTDAPYVGDKLYQLKVNLWNEAMSALGVANVSQMKKERMVSSEINNLMGGTLAQRYSFIQARQEAADAINDMFGTDITVVFRDGDVDADGNEVEPLGSDEEIGGDTDE